MPSFGNQYTVNWKRWYACMTKVAEQMVRDGWNKHARKFSEVQRRRAGKLYINGGTV